MPLRLVIAATAALVLAPAAGATRPPLAPSMPAELRGLHALSLADSGKHAQTTSCSVHRSRAGTTADKLGRKIVPVACEQPPRSQLKIDVLKQAVANAATAITGP
jgi:hypothetical protein